jgi:hypothetical protein
MLLPVICLWKINVIIIIIFKKTNLLLADGRLIDKENVRDCVNNSNQRTVLAE